ncbi:MAG: hypothetical protein LBG80_15445 [Bacteroidales bacterium]|jgi:hypothetical protein|nr:hypothetical protein [Bacteroidales bacterium]
MHTNTHKYTQKTFVPVPLRGLTQKISELTGYTLEGSRKSLKKLIMGKPAQTIMDMEVFQATKEYATKLGVTYEELFTK